LGQGTLLSVEYLNWAANEVTGDPTDGGFFHDLLKGFNRHGICLEADMPYQKRFNPQLRPSDQAIQRAKDILDMGLSVHWINPLRRRPGLTDDLLHEIQAVLARGYPVAAGSSHSRLIVGYVVDAGQPGGGYFLIKDSGAAAYNTITFKFAADHVGDVFWVEAPARPRGSKPGQ